MRKYKDVTGKRFGKLVALEYSHSNNGRTYWLFECSCGKKVGPRRIDAVKRRKNSSCGNSLCSGRIKNIVGKRFGKLLVTEFSHSVGEYSYWVCKCKCGNITHPISSVCLKSGVSKTCGSGLCNGKIINLTGQIFGELKVIKFSHSKRFNSGVSVSHWTCECSCGKITKPIQATHLKSGTTKSCGCCKLISETNLCKIIEKIFGNKYSIERHYSPDWLQPQHVDGAVFDNGRLIFVFEYDGEQHFIPISYWGGKERLNYQKKIDAKKNKVLCERNIPTLRVSFLDKDKKGEIKIDAVVKRLMNIGVIDE
jgi:hypothetical protein